MLRISGIGASYIIVALLVGFSTGICRADDWPQWLGPERDGIWRETGIVKEFPADGPKVRWRVPVGAGYTGPAVANGRVYVMDRQRPTVSGAPGGTAKRGAIPGSERIL